MDTNGKLSIWMKVLQKKADIIQETRTILKEHHLCENCLGRIIKTIVNYQNPDIVFTLDFKNEECEIKPKPVFLSGRYTKTVRGIPQKQRPCENCGGKGCYACEFHGISEFESVEGKIAKFLYEKFG